MILNAIFHIITGIITTAVSFFPTADAEILSFINSKITVINENLSYINQYFPSGDLVRILTFILTIELVMFTVKILAWLLSMVTGGLFKNSV